MTITYSEIIHLQSCVYCNDLLENQNSYQRCSKCYFGVSIGSEQTVWKWDTSYKKCVAYSFNSKEFQWFISTKKGMIGNQSGELLEWNDLVTKLEEIELFI